MRNARLQSQDLARTNQFINTLLSKDELKNEQKPDSADASKAHLVNGNAVSFRADPKARFSDPPAPPPQQPLPEKPDVARPHASDVPSLKRGTTERPKSQTSPIRPDNLQILQLTEALQVCRKELDTQQAQMKELEERLHIEREARKSAEELARRLEDAAAATAKRPAVDDAAGVQESVLEDAFDPPIELPSAGPDPPADAAAGVPSKEADPGPDPVAVAQSRIESLATEVKGLKQRVDEYKQRAETAEAERDAVHVTLAEMVVQIRKRDEEDARKRRRSRSRGDKKAGAAAATHHELSLDGAFSGLPAANTTDGPADEQPSLSRANTITPGHSQLAKHSPDSAALHGVPYASMLGVVLIGMGLMAYINGWQQQPRIAQ